MADKRATPTAPPRANDKMVQMSVRVPADLAYRFERVAQQEDRTVSAQLRRVIRLCVEQFAQAEEPEGSGAHDRQSVAALREPK